MKKVYKIIPSLLVIIGILYFIFWFKLHGPVQGCGPAMYCPAGTGQTIVNYFGIRPTIIIFIFAGIIFWIGVIRNKNKHD